MKIVFPNVYEIIKDIVAPQNKLTDEDIEKLKPYEKILNDAISSSFVRGLSIEDRKAIYKIFNDAGYRYDDCGKCGRKTLEDLKVFGALYFDKVKNIENNDGAEKRRVEGEESPTTKKSTKRQRKNKRKVK